MHLREQSLILIHGTENLSSGIYCLEIAVLYFTVLLKYCTGTLLYW